MNIQHIAKLANIPLKPEEEEKLEKQLDVTLEHAERLKEITTESVTVTSQVTGLENVTREDIAAPSLPQKKALANAKVTYNGFFKVKAVLEQ
jgi:aspartyl/glutamyl-tRNA(Asn/Gln) amidotransferase C subunit